MESRNQYIINAFLELRHRLSDHAPFNQQDLAEEELDFLDKWDKLVENIKTHETGYSFDAQELLSRYIRCYANLVPLVKRELLWFIGGECLHFLGDEEIQLYQQLEERLYELEQSGKNYNIAKEIETLRGNSVQLH